MLVSPYSDHPRSDWRKITEKLVKTFPLAMKDLVSAVEDAWEDLYTSSFGRTGLQIGADIFLPAQATGVILEKLIAVHLSDKFAGWRGGREKFEKDIINENELKYSFEIKTSSSRAGLYGNRSTGHRSEGRTKFRTGYYLVVNYKLPRENDPARELQNIRFGWIDDEDWVGQAQPTGQQASIGVELARLKLVTIKGDI